MHFTSITRLHCSVNLLIFTHITDDLAVILTARIAALRTTILCLSVGRTRTNHAASLSWGWLHGWLNSRRLETKGPESELDLCLHHLGIIVSTMHLICNQCFCQFTQEQPSLAGIVLIPGRILWRLSHICCYTRAIYNVEEHRHWPSSNLALASVKSHQMVKVVYSRLGFVVVNDYFWLIWIANLHCSIMMHSWEKHCCLSFLRHIAGQGQLTIKTEDGWQFFPCSTW